MNRQASYPRWKAPSEDGAALIWPEPLQLITGIHENHKRLASSDVRVQNVALNELRRRQRQWISHDDSQPLLVSAHQTELYHPGVWAKLALSSAVAPRVSGQALHIAVDTDAPKHLHLRLPDTRQSPITLRQLSVTDDPRLSGAAWTALLDAPSPRHIAHLESELRETPLDWTPMLADFLASLRRLSLQQPDLATALTNATHELDWSLGLRHHAILASPLLMSEPYLVLAHHILARAIDFARDYNAALSDYRRDANVRSATRPMPDLAIHHDQCEVPFWLDDLRTGRRTRATVAIRERFLLKTSDGAFEFDPALDGWTAAQRLAEKLRQHQLRLSPRALTLTLLVRLLLADQFIHGIGGARYDQVTSNLIARHFNLDPPAFAVTTATLYLPGAHSRARACVSCVQHQGHQLRHSLLGKRKQELVHAIVSAPRKSDQRRQLFHQMHRELADAAVWDKSIAAWRMRLHQTELQHNQDMVVFDREQFYALQPRDRLHDLLSRYAASFAV